MPHVVFIFRSKVPFNCRLKHPKKSGRKPQLLVVHACNRGNPFRVTSLPVALSVMHNGTTTIVVVQNVAVAHVHTITSGSTTTTHHHHKYDFVRAHILLLHTYFIIHVCVMLIIEDPTVTVKCRTAITTLFLYFKLCLSVMLDSLSC